MYVPSMPAAVMGGVVSPAVAAKPDAHAAEAAVGTPAAGAIVLDDDDVDSSVAGIADVPDVATAAAGALEDDGDNSWTVAAVSTTSDARAAEIVGTEERLLEHDTAAHITIASATIR
jgi:hypothetical protein